MEGLTASPLFAGMSEDEIRGCLRCSRTEIAEYQRDERIFCQQDEPKKLFVLLKGAVVICDDSSAGKRSILTTFDRPGELFGEVYLFLNRPGYDHYAQAAVPSSVLRMPKEFLYHTCGEHCDYHARLISNMLSILAQKAYYLNRKLQIVSCATLRQKIAKVLLQNSSADGRVTLPMNREELADFLNAARPSLSRELMRMQEDGLLRVGKREIFIMDPGRLEDV